MGGSQPSDADTYLATLLMRYDSMRVATTSRAPAMIPRNIIIFWHDFNSIPQPIADAVNDTIANNPDYQIIKADDSFVSKIIEKRYGSLVRGLYENNRVAASRSDMARLILLYEYGGFYVDAGMGLQKSLDYMRGKGPLILVRHDTMQAFSQCPQHAHFCNGFIGAEPASDFIKDCIKLMLSNLIAGEYNISVNTSTGPQVINRMHHLRPPKSCDIYSFADLDANLFSYRRCKGVSNSWMCDQFNGVIDPAVYKYGWKKSILSIMGRVAFRISFAFLYMPKNKLSKNN